MDIYFNRNPVFKVLPKRERRGTIAWFDSGKTLRSGWALGEAYHEGGATVVGAHVGKGRLCSCRPSSISAANAWRFKFLFNGIYFGSAEAMEP